MRANNELAESSASIILREFLSQPMYIIIRFLKNVTFHIVFFFFFYIDMMDLDIFQDDFANNMM